MHLRNRNSWQHLLIFWRQKRFLASATKFPWPSPSSKRAMNRDSVLNSRSGASNLDQNWCSGVDLPSLNGINSSSKHTAHLCNAHAKQAQECRASLTPVEGLDQGAIGPMKRASIENWIEREEKNGKSFKTFSATFSNCLNNSHTLTRGSCACSARKQIPLWRASLGLAKTIETRLKTLSDKQILGRLRRKIDLWHVEGHLQIDLLRWHMQINLRHNANTWTFATEN